MSALQPVSLRCEFLSNPLGIDNTQPRLSWVVESKERNQIQTAYRILVASSVEKLESESGDLWDTGKLMGDQTLGLRYAGVPLRSGMRCYWKVRSWDRNGTAGPWSESGSWSMGLLSRQDWVGEWIGYDAPRKKEHGVPFSKAQWIWYAGDKEPTLPAGTRYFARVLQIPEVTNISAMLFFILRRMIASRCM